jgi:hypothetical protein
MAFPRRSANFMRASRGRMPCRASGVRGSTISTSSVFRTLPAAGPAHRYAFTLYALDTLISLPPMNTRADLRKVIHGRIQKSGNGIVGACVSSSVHGRCQTRWRRTYRGTSGMSGRNVRVDSSPRRPRGPLELPGSADCAPSSSWYGTCPLKLMSTEHVECTHRNNNKPLRSAMLVFHARRVTNEDPSRNEESSNIDN